MIWTSYWPITNEHDDFPASERKLFTSQSLMVYVGSLKTLCYQPMGTELDSMSVTFVCELFYNLRTQDQKPVV